MCLKLRQGYIDLSKRRATAEDISAAEIRYTKSKAVHSIMRHTAEKLGLRLEDLYEQVAWPLYRTYGHAYDAFKVAVADEEKVFGGLTMGDDVKKELLNGIRRRFVLFYFLGN